MELYIVAGFIVLFIILFFQTQKIDPAELDKKMISDWWTGSKEFIDEAGLKYIFIKFESAGNKVNGYITAGDNEGLIYNNPLTITLSAISSEDKYKGKYTLSDIKGESPFPENSTLIIDRTNSSFSVYKNDVLYGHFIK